MGMAWGVSVSSRGFWRVWVQKVFYKFYRHLIAHLGEFGSIIGVGTYTYIFGKFEFEYAMHVPCRICFYCKFSRHFNESKGDWYWAKRPCGCGHMHLLIRRVQEVLGSLGSNIMWTLHLEFVLIASFWYLASLGWLRLRNVARWLWAQAGWWSINVLSIWLRRALWMCCGSHGCNFLIGLCHFIEFLCIVDSMLAHFAFGTLLAIGLLDVRANLC